MVRHSFQSVGSAASLASLGVAVASVLVGFSVQAAPLPSERPSTQPPSTERPSTEPPSTERPAVESPPRALLVEPPPNQVPPDDDSVSPNNEDPSVEEPPEGEEPSDGGAVHVVPMLAAFNATPNELYQGATTTLHLIRRGSEVRAPCLVTFRSQSGATQRVRGVAFPSGELACEVEFEPSEPGTWIAETRYSYPGARSLLAQTRFAVLALPEPPTLRARQNPAFVDQEVMLEFAPINPGVKTECAIQLSSPAGNDVTLAGQQRVRTRCATHFVPDVPGVWRAEAQARLPNGETVTTQTEIVVEAVPLPRLSLSPHVLKLGQHVRVELADIHEAIETDCSFTATSRAEEVTPVQGTRRASSCVARFSPAAIGNWAVTTRFGVPGRGVQEVSEEFRVRRTVTPAGVDPPEVTPPREGEPRPSGDRDRPFPADVEPPVELLPGRDSRPGDSPSASSVVAPDSHERPRGDERPGRVLAPTETKPSIPPWVWPLLGLGAVGGFVVARRFRSRDSTEPNSTGGESRGATPTGHLNLVPPLPPFEFSTRLGVGKFQLQAAGDPPLASSMILRPVLHGGASVRVRTDSLAAGVAMVLRPTLGRANRSMRVTKNNPD